MERESLVRYDRIPEDMAYYISYNGRHFSRKLLKYALGKMKDKDGNKLNPISKEEFDSLLEKYNIHIENNELYDYLYVANMCKADFFGRSVIDEHRLCMFVKDYIDDADGYECIAFNRWLADMAYKGIPIDWYSLT